MQSYAHRGDPEVEGALHRDWGDRHDENDTIYDDFATTPVLAEATHCGPHEHQ